MRKLGFWIVLPLLLSWAGCKKDFVLPDDVREISFLPSETSQLIDQFNEDPHLAWISNDQVLKNYLLVHLPGTFGAPDNSRRFPALAAGLGYHALSLMYPNDKAAAPSCKDSADPDCFDNFREEICLGNSVSGDVDVHPGNDIRSRLVAALEWLNQNFPGEGWGNYLQTNGEPEWSRIIISGHSQGGGHAGFLATRFSVRRCLMFASPNDFSEHFNEPATWVRGPKQTQVTRYYAFGHERDGVASYEYQVRQWEAMGLASSVAVTNIDGKSPPYGDAQALSTDVNPRPRVSTHSCVIADAVTPIDRDGVAEFAPVWQYMLGE